MRKKNTPEVRYSLRQHKSIEKFVKKLPEDLELFGQEILDRADNLIVDIVERQRVTEKQKKSLAHMKQSLFSWLWVKPGDRFGKIVAISDIFCGCYNQKRIKVRCDCGKEYEIDVRFLKDGKSKRCRTCAGIESSKPKHGHRSGGKRESLYVKWVGIRGRCCSIKDKDYKNFGLKGIKVSKEWDKYSDFREWAYKSGYKEGLNLYRKNVAKDYCPSNCSWADKRSASLKKYEFRGESLTVNELHVKVRSCVPLKTVKNRLTKKWPLLEALLRPVGVKIRKRVVVEKIKGNIKKSKPDTNFRPEIQSSYDSGEAYAI